MNQAYYETTAFFLHHNCILAPVEFLCCTNDRDGYLLRLILFHGRSIFWKTLLFSLPSLLDFLTVLINATVMLTSLKTFTPGKGPRPRP